MPTNSTYSLTELATLADVTPRTVRYYIAQGLLPSPGQVGPGARYSGTHLARLRIIRRLQREHLPLGEIRNRVTELTDEAVESLVNEPEASSRVAGSAVDYVRAVLAGPEPLSSGPSMMTLGPVGRFALLKSSAPDVLVSGLRLGAPSPDDVAEPRMIERSQWDRVALGSDLELHVRRPLSRIQNRRVERLVAFARQLLEEDQP